MATVLEFITDAARLGNILGPGQTLSNEEAQEMLRHLNRMLAMWNTERLNVFQILYSQFSLTTNVQSYTIGTGATFNIPRPLSILAAVLIISGIDNPMNILGPEEWAGKRDKTLTGKLPEDLYNDYAFPLSTIKVLPIPSQACDIGLFTWQKFAAFALLTDAVAFPDGYEQAIMFNLAYVVGAAWGAPISQDVIATAVASKQALRDLNVPPTPGSAEQMAGLRKAAMAGMPQQGQQ